MIRRGIVLPSRRFFAWTGFIVLAPMTLTLLAWADKADAAHHPFGIEVAILVGCGSFALVMGALELLKRVEAAGWSFDAPLWRNWVGYYGLWTLVGLGIGCARATALQAAFGVAFAPGRYLFEVAMCLYAMLLVAFSLENQTVFLREAARKQEASRRAVRFLFESREAFFKARDLRRHEVVAVLERQVEPELQAIHEGVTRLRQGHGELLETLLARLDHLRDAEIRNLSHLLHPSIIEVGLAPALRALVRSRQGAFELEVESVLLESFTPALRLQLYRVVEQLLDMVPRHAAGRIRLGAEGDRPGALMLDVDFRGEGVALEPLRQGAGLALLDARVALLSGEWAEQSEHPERVGLRLRFPLPVA
ncbi:hypothetical protein J7643_12395 [bacterium]|nr:hypothetical protein [bacterium]